MNTLYQLHVSDRVDRHGVSTWMQTGIGMTLDGEAMVKLPHGVIVRAEAWSESEHDARLVAAMKVEQWGRKLLEQAEQLRASAAAPQEVKA